MKKYEYTIVHPGELRKQKGSEASAEDLQGFLNSFGTDGWKYKSVIVHGNDSHFLFEKELPDEPENIEVADESAS